MNQHEIETLKSILGALPENNREALWRYYLLEQSPAEICRDLQLKMEDFQRMKSEVTSHFHARKGSAIG